MPKTIIIPETEYFNEATEEFFVKKEVTLVLEHSLVSLSKWEQKHHKPFLGKGDKTPEEVIDYIRCMTLSQHIPEDAYSRLTNQNINEISDYINDPMTATWFNEDKSKAKNTEVITNEIIYYWMIALNIPVEFQKWHLNHLLTLIQVCNIKNQPPKKMSKRQIMSRHQALNAARRKQLNSKG